MYLQEEDGRRDRSPSRGLGDVYKRQVEEIGIKINVQLWVKFVPILVQE